MSTSIDLTPLARRLDAVSHNIDVVYRHIEVVDGKVTEVVQRQHDTRQALDAFYAEFCEFVAADVRAKALQIASTNIIQVRQELEQRFGHYAEVRRAAYSILQATDVALVRQNTIATATENFMISAPGYWLAPALVALSAWIADDRPLAERALAVAIQRDDSKTSLLFALVARRARRGQANTTWLKRYFQNQNPTSMDREVVVMIDALANGVFGAASLGACSEVVNEWLAELEEQAGFADEQRNRWAAAIGILAPPSRPDDYPTLRKYSPTWPQLDATLSAARRNQVVLDFFGNIFAGEIVPPPTLEAAVDEILENLVKNYDDEELPLRRSERRCQLIVEENGDVDRAERRLDVDLEALEEHTNFAAILTNSAMNPQLFGATRATQRYAIALSRTWLLQAYQDLVTRDRSHTPRDVSLKCGSWEGKASAATNEGELVASLRRHYEQRIEQALAAVALPPLAWGAAVGGGILALLCLLGAIVALGSSGFASAVLFFFLALLSGGVGAAVFYYHHQNLDKRRADARAALEHECGQALQILRASLAELTDLGREIAAEDAKAAEVVTFVESLNSPQFILSGPERQRASIA